MIDEKKNELEMLGGSHLPVLMATVALTGNTVLEIGVGNFSTPILHAACSQWSRRLVSLESDPEWLEWAKKYSGLRHDVLRPDADLMDMFGIKKFSVVLVDDSPGNNRASHVERYLHSSTFIVVHDAEGEDVIGPIRPLIENIPHILYQEYRPWTLVIGPRVDELGLVGKQTRGGPRV